MTVSSQVSSVSYLGDGVTTLLPVPYYFLEQTHLLVTRVNLDASTSTLILGSDYSVAGAGNQAGGSITMFVAPAIGVQIIIDRAVPATQETDYVPNDPFPAESHERALDKLTMLVQQNIAMLGRSLLRPLGKNYYDAEGRLISNLADPVSPQDAATKNWVGDYIDGVSGLINNTMGIAYDGGTLYQYLQDGVIRVVSSIAELKTLSSLRNRVAIIMAPGWSNIYRVDQADLTTANNDITVIVGNDGARWKAVSPNPQIPTIGQAIKLTGINYTLQYPAENLLKNSTFFIWHDSGPAPMVTSLPENSNAIVLSQWRMETAIAGTTVNSIRRITSPVGGLRFNAVFGPSTGFVYVRQNVLGVQSFSGKLLVATVDFDVDGSCQLDFYVRMRMNALNDDANRPLVVLTPAINISAGRQTVSVVMQCPDVTTLQGIENQQQSLEYAFRFIGINATRDVKVYGSSVTPGNIAMAAGSQDPVRDRSDAEVQYETGTQSFVGWTNSLGQRRITANFKTEKYRTPVVTISDAVGTVGAVSTYDVAGTRTDGVTGYLIAVTTTGIEITFASSTIAGIRFNYAANCYF